jgi:hypothetical protein
MFRFARVYAHASIRAEWEVRNCKIRRTQSGTTQEANSPDAKELKKADDELRHC